MANLEQQTLDYESNLDRVKAMMRQEQASYSVKDFLRNLPEESEFGKCLDIDARRTIADWCFRIMDICQYKRETATIAISFLDRLSCTKQGHAILQDRGKYQVAALSAVYTAVKIHEQQALSPLLVAKLSNGAYSVKDIESMELNLLQALQWRVNPPTPMEFVRLLLSLIPHNNVLDADTRDVVAELAEHQINTCLLNYAFCTQRASSLGFAAVLNAFESVFGDNDALCSHIEAILSECTGIDVFILRDLRAALYEVIAVTETPAQLKPKLHEDACYGNPEKAPRSGNSLSKSPRSVLR